MSECIFGIPFEGPLHMAFHHDLPHFPPNSLQQLMNQKVTKIRDLRTLIRLSITFGRSERMSSRTVGFSSCTDVLSDHPTKLRYKIKKMCQAYTGGLNTLPSWKNKDIIAGINMWKFPDDGQAKQPEYNTQNECKHTMQ